MLRWGHGGGNRLYARGQFSAQLDALAEKMERDSLLPNQNEIRVMLMHHSYSHDEMELGITDHSRQALREAIGVLDVAVTLTGHTHEPKLTQHRVRHQAQDQLFWECRCGTTTQRTKLPLDLSTLSGKRPDWPNCVNSLIVHELYERDESIVWDATVCWLGTYGFSASLGARSIARMRRSFYVWPPEKRGLIA